LGFAQLADLRYPNRIVFRSRGYPRGVQYLHYAHGIFKRSQIARQDGFNDPHHCSKHMNELL